MLVSIVVGVVSTGVVVVVVAVELVVADVVDVVVVVGAVDSSLLNQPECLLISIHLWVGAEKFSFPYKLDKFDCLQSTTFFILILHVSYPSLSKLI